MKETKTSLQEVIVGVQDSLGNSTDTCEICKGMWSCFLDLTEPLQTSLGYTDNPLPPRCSGHSPLFIYWRDNSQDHLTDGVEAINQATKRIQEVQKTREMQRSEHRS